MRVTICQILADLASPKIHARVTSLTAPGREKLGVAASPSRPARVHGHQQYGAKMKVRPGSLILLAGLAACAARSEESADESTKVATDTLVETKQVVDTMVVKKETTVAADTTVRADTTIVADTSVTADTTVAADTTRVGDQGVIKVDTTSAQ